MLKLQRICNKISRIIDYIMDEIKYFFLNIGLADVLKRNKKLIGFYGECHMYIYGSALSACAPLKRQYRILGAKEIEYLVKWHSKRINKRKAWDQLDVLIYNPGVPVRKGAPSLEDVLSWVPERCKKIEVTNAAFKGYMPQHTERVFSNEGYFIWGDKNLNKLLEEGIEEREIDSSIRKVSGKDFYDPEYVNSYFEKSVKRMKQYERRCTIKIADYIEAHGKDKLLYYSVTHPEDDVMREITIRILRELGIEVDKGSLTGRQSGLFNLHSHGEVVYPSVAIGLGLEEAIDGRRIQPGNYKDLTYSFEEYVQGYLKMGKEGVSDQARN